MEKIIKSLSLPVLLLMFAIGGGAVGMVVYLKLFSHVEHDYLKPKQMNWSFDGAFGNVDKQSAQRGYQVYKEVCAACHSMKQVPFRALSAIGFSEAEIKTIAASYDIQDGPDAEGEMFDRPGLPSDYFVSPYANENQARATNGGAYPPDLSLMVKARPDGANYLYSLLTGYEYEAPEGFKLNEGMNYNPYFHGRQIAMAAPLMDDLVTYSDNTPSTVDQMSRDVVNFMQWAAEPEMEQRKKTGFRVMIYMAIFTVLFYFAKVAVWARAKL